MESARSDVLFKHRVAPYWTVDAKVPELAVAYDEPYVRDLYRRCGLERYRVYWGMWSGRPPFASEHGGLSQDVVVTTKT
jgi:hypothetical protein